MGPEDELNQEPTKNDEVEDTRTDEQKAADAERVVTQHTTTERVEGPAGETEAPRD